MKMILRICLVVIGITIFKQDMVVCFSQYAYDKLTDTREITIKKQDSIINFEILIKKPDYKVNSDLYYYWYGSEKVLCNKGGYTGSLLHGKYEVFTNQNMLIEKGSFSNGLKNDIWIEWYPGGNIKSKSHWSNGILNGEYLLYNANGKLISSEVYKNGQFDGIQTYYTESNDTIIKKYNNGIEQIKKEREKEAHTETIENYEDLGSASEESKKEKSLFFWKNTKKSELE